MDMCLLMDDKNKNSSVERKILELFEFYRKIQC
jgi:hypothetical protein